MINFSIFNTGENIETNNVDRNERKQANNNPPTNVTMNINMYMYPKVMNIDFMGGNNNPMIGLGLDNTYRTPNHMDNNINSKILSNNMKEPSK